VAMSALPTVLSLVFVLTAVASVITTLRQQKPDGLNFRSNGEILS